MTRRGRQSRDGEQAAIERHGLEVEDRPHDEESEQGACSQAATETGDNECVDAGADAEDEAERHHREDGENEPDCPVKTDEST